MPRPAKKRTPRKRAPNQRQSPSCKLTPAIFKEIVELVARGNFRMVAVDKAGVPRWTYSSWITAGNKQLRELTNGERDRLMVQGQFVMALRAAEAQAHIETLDDVRNSDDIRAKMWFLEKRYSRHYNKNMLTALDDETGEEIQIDAAALLAEKLRLLIQGDGDAT